MAKVDLYDFIFHYNPYTNQSYAIKKGDNNWEKYTNGEKFNGYKIKGNDFKSLQEIITKELRILKPIER
jgi:hypothetical protein